MVVLLLLLLIGYIFVSAFFSKTQNKEHIVLFHKDRILMKRHDCADTGHFY